MMENIKLEALFEELRGQTFVKSVNLVLSQGSSATISDAQVYINDKVYVQNKGAYISLTITSITETMVTRIDQGDGLIIENLFIITS